MDSHPRLCGNVPTLFGWHVRVDVPARSDKLHDGRELVSKDQSLVLGGLSAETRRVYATEEKWGWDTSADHPVSETTRRTASPIATERKPSSATADDGQTFTGRFAGAYFCDS